MTKLLATVITAAIALSGFAANAADAPAAKPAVTKTASAKPTKAAHAGKKATKKHHAKVAAKHTNKTAG